jgi:hypothetical protein
VEAVAQTGANLQESAAENAQASLHEILSAPVLDEADANELRRQDRFLTDEEVAALARWRIASAFDLDEPSTLTSEHIEFYHRQGGKPRRAIAAFDLARRDSFDWREKDAEQPAVTRRFMWAQRAMFREFLESLGVDPVTGSGEWGRATAARALSVVDHHWDVATKLGIRGTGRGVKPQRAIASVLARLGLTVTKTGSRRRPRWSISAESWATMVKLSACWSGSHGGAQPQSRAEAFAKARVAFEEAHFFEGPTADRLPDFLAQHLRKRSPVFLLDAQWIRDTAGVSRATAYRRVAHVKSCYKFQSAQAWKISLGGYNSTTTEQVDAISYLTDADMIRTEVERITGRTVRAIEATEQPVPEQATATSDKQSAGAQATEQSAHTQRPEASDSEQITLAAIQRNAGLTPMKAGLYADRGRKFRHKIQRSTPSESVRAWLNRPNTESQRLVDMALGANRGDPAAAQKWIQTHVAWEAA